MKATLILVFVLCVLISCAFADDEKEDQTQWDKIGSKLSEFWDKTKDSVSEGAKVIGQHAEKFGQDAKTTAEKLFKNVKTEVGITPDTEKKIESTETQTK